MIMRFLERILPGEVIWQFPMNLFTRLDHFTAPVEPGKIARRREAVLISILIGRGRVPSAGPIQCDRDRDLYRQLPCLPARSVLDFVQTARFSTARSNPPVAYNSGVRPPLQSKQKRGLSFLPSRAILNPTGDASNEVRAVSIRRAIHHIPSER